MRTRLDQDRYDAYRHNYFSSRENTPTNFEDNAEFRKQLRSMIEYDVRELFGYKIRARCLKQVLSEPWSFLDQELQTVVDIRTEEKIKKKVHDIYCKTLKSGGDTRHNSWRFNKKSYILTLEEREAFNAHEKARLERLRNPPKLTVIKHEDTVIKKNGLDVLIGANRITTFRTKDGRILTIDRSAPPKHQKNYEPFETIIRECAEVWLHSKWITRILGMRSSDDLRRVAYFARKFGYNISTTPRSQFKTAETLRVLDEDRMFIVEKPNPYRVENQSKSADEMVKK